MTSARTIYEEINVAPATAAGLNYGWPITRGAALLRPDRGLRHQRLTLLRWSRLSTVMAVPVPSPVGWSTGGQAIPELVGHYFYSDFCGGWLRSFLSRMAGARPSRDWTEQVGVPGNVVSFGTDAAGEVYVLTTEIKCCG